MRRQELTTRGGVAVGSESLTIADNRTSLTITDNRTGRTYEV
jgi:hypothetical protein